MKECSKCKQQKPFDQFYRNKGTKDGFGSWCKACDTDFKRAQRKEQKKLLVEANGGKCSRCGYARCLTALEFHHPNQDKENDVSSLGHSLDKAIKESQKCSLVCANCHREIHEGL